MIVTVCGPSGAGKTKITQQLNNLFSYQNILLCTTRMPRPDEKQEIDYHFLSKTAFQELQYNNQLLNIEEYPADRLYGILKQDIKNAAFSKDIYIIPVTPAGMREIEKVIDPENLVKVYLVFDCMINLSVFLVLIIVLKSISLHCEIR